MKHISITPRIYEGCAAGLCLLGVILRTVCLLTQYDSEVGYFNKGWLSSASCALYFVALACFVAGAFTLPKGHVASGLTQIPHTVAAYLLALVLAGFAVGMVMQWLGNRERTILLSMAVVAIAAAIYFVLSARRKELISDGLAALGATPVLWGILALGETYVDPYTTINSPLKLALQMGFLGFMLLMTVELRFGLGKSSPRRAVCLHAVAAFTCLVASIPVLVGFVADVKMDTLYPLYAAVLLAVGIYALLSFPRTSPTPVEGAPENSEANEEV